MKPTRCWKPAAALLLALGFALLATPGEAAQSRRIEFDHMRTGFPLTGQHATLRCETCHVNGVFRGTPTQCAVCHSQGNRMAATFKPNNHVPTNDQCDLCHISTASWTVARFQHFSVMPGSCAQCHNGTTSPGKPANHIQTTASCDTCHMTAAWNPATFSHAGVTPGTCATCHNGTTGKPANHIVTIQSCDACHNTSTWLTANGHPSVAPGTCGTCHNGTTATGMPSSHVPIAATMVTGALACDACHTAGFTAWGPGTFVNHADVKPGTCATCHNGTYATGKPANHIVTIQSCDTCHNTSTFLGATGHPTVTPGTCGTCHNGTTATGMPSSHVPIASTMITGSLACDACHTAGFTAWGPGTLVNHANVKPGTCGTCHNGTYGTGMASNHIPITAAVVIGVTPTGCDACHTSGYTAWGPGTRLHAHVSVITSACYLCHNGAYTAAGAQGQGTNHPANGRGSTDCYQCHKSYNSWDN